MHLQEKIFLRERRKLEKEAAVSKRSLFGLNSALLVLFLLVSPLLGCDTGGVTLLGCDNDKECPQGRICENGVCIRGERVPTPVVPEGCTPGEGGGEGCAEGEICYPTADGRGQCAPKVCANSGECPDGWSCVGGTCAPDSCSDDTHCPHGWSCTGNVCIPQSCANDNGCPGDLVCNEAGKCVVCDPDTHNGCTAANPVCLPTSNGQGQCMPEGSCNSDTQCPGVCVNGRCVVCDPGTGRGCDAGAGESCRSTGDGQGECVRPCNPQTQEGCTGSEVCLPTGAGGVGECHAEGRCLLDNPTSNPGWGCVAGYQCQDSMDTPNGVGICLPVDCNAPDMECPPGWTCSATGTCIPDTCNSDTQCPGVCVNGRCVVCDPLTDRGCDTDNGETCRVTADGQGICALENCDNHNQCPDEWSCIGGTCTPDSCTDDNQCPSGWTCEVGACIPGNCTDRSQCPNGWSCVGNVCLPDSCNNDDGCPGSWVCSNGECVVCDLDSHNGCPGSEVCLPTGAGEVGECHPHGSCLLDEPDSCDPPYQCQNSMYTPPGVGTCVPATCNPNSHPGDCPPDWECRDPFDTGTGICVPLECTPGVDAECPDQWICEDLGNTGTGTCVGDFYYEGNTGLSNTVLPLAWTNGRLVIATTAGTGSGSSSTVAFFNPREGSTAHSTNLSLVGNVGPMTGLATMGNSGRVVMTHQNRVSVVHETGNGGVGFVSETRASDCTTSQTPLSNHAFNYGPTLLSIGNNDGSGAWRFVVPVNDNGGYDHNDHRLLAYLPFGSTGSGSTSSANCILTTGFPWGPVAPLVWAPTPSSSTQNIVYIRKEHNNVHSIVLREWDNANSTWLSHIGLFEFPKFTDMVGIAVDRENVWATVYADGSSVLSRQSRTNLTLRALLTESVDTTSPPALDADGSAYVVVRLNCTPPCSYELQRHLSDVTGNNAAETPHASGSLGQSSHAPVGSPILGEPVGNNPAEVYVVTTDGTVYAFRADNLQPLWTQGLAINVSPTAQPVLKGNRLWLVSTNGQVRSVLVNSNGLSRSARWPKMHRDNCNSNSHLTTPDLPSCF